MPRFVVLRHEPPPDVTQPPHWDLMLEQGEVLRTWALEQQPQPGRAISAAGLADHRPAYLDYEGPVSGNRGQVTRWDRGSYEMLRDSPSEILIRLTGEKLRGVVRLSRRRGDAQRWIVEFPAASGAAG